jgi:hypothetical protein
VNQRARAGIGGNPLGVSEGIADLAQRNGAERRRQIEHRRIWRKNAALCVDGHEDSQF